MITKRKFVKINSAQVEKYLGDMAVDEFESTLEIEKYFDPDNLISMFGSDADLSDASVVRSWIIQDWLENRHLRLQGR